MYNYAIGKTVFFSTFFGIFCIYFGNDSYLSNKIAYIFCKFPKFSYAYYAVYCA